MENTMKIAQAVVEQNSSRDYSSESEIRLQSESSFRTVFDQVSETTAAVSADDTGEQTRLMLLLETLIARMLEILTGKPGSSFTDLREVAQADARSGPLGATARPRARLEMEWKSEKTEYFHEEENTCFSSCGKIATQDGRQLDFRLELVMNRTYTRESTTSESGRAVLHDPLVINFAGQSAALSGKRFSFDLDADGKSESMYGLAAGSGYLAIDSNADGRINDGSELFGPGSGDGFAELSRLDGDGNHWLDEADAAYASMRIWSQDGEGPERLSRLREAGVGALYLGASETAFNLTDGDNRLLAQIRATGIYLKEDGRAGTLQQIDLAL
jgi:hypothetical protein